MKTVKENLIFKNKFAEFYNNDVIDFNGNPAQHITYSKINKEKIESVCVLPINKSGEILIFKEYRYAIQGYIYNIPAGGAEKGLSIKENAQKELFEESGLVSTCLEKVNIKSFSDPSIRNLMVNYFLAYSCEGDISTDNKEGTEHFMDYEWIDVNILWDRIVEGKIEITLTALPIIFYYYNLIKK